MSLSAARLPTTTRSISSSTAVARAVVVAAVMAVSEVIPPASPLSYLPQPFQDFFQRRPPRTGFTRAGVRDVIGVHPRPQLWAEKCSPGGIERGRILGLLLSGSDREPPRQHGAQMPVPIGSGRFRPVNHRLGPCQPVSQGFLESVRDRRRQGVETAPKVLTHADQREERRRTGRP